MDKNSHMLLFIYIYFLILVAESVLITNGVFEKWFNIGCVALLIEYNYKSRHFKDNLIKPVSILTYSKKLGELVQ